MLRSALTLGLLTTTPVFAQTAAQEERLLEAVKAMEAQSYTYYVSVDPRFGPLLTPVKEDPAYRESQRCFLNKIAEEGGPDMLEEYIEAVEVQAATEITSLIELGQRVPAVMYSDLVLSASAECGPMSYSTKQMATPEFLKLMDEPEVVRGLMGQ